MRVFLNDRLVPEGEARVSVFDHGFLYGDGVYETLRVYGGTVFMAGEHLARLGRSAGRIGLRLPMDSASMARAVDQTLRANALTEAYVRITVSRGPGPLGLDPALCPRPTFVVMAMPFKPYPAEFFENGVRLMIPETRRNHRMALDPAIKSLNFLNNILAKRESIDAGAFDALMLNTDGHLTECTVSNVFFVRGGALHTPSLECGLLEGITRGLLMELARGLGVEVREGLYTPDDIYRADEVFVSNTTMEVMPVGSVDRAKFAAGAVTRALMAAYKTRTPR